MKLLQKIRSVLGIKDKPHWPISREEALKAADRVAELDDQEGLGELTVERSGPLDPSDDKTRPSED
uniref:Uncharacterized protein n=1 Tax=candidate division WWE3 bacterium TaxID=2053526 RepID=A0A831Z0J3_UNCKA